MNNDQNASLPTPGMQPPATPPAQQAAAPQQPAMPAIADDNDLIEKEWVEQVKRVLQSNAGNPYEQNRQLAKLRADYMQKRYGKDLKTSE